MVFKIMKTSVQLNYKIFSTPIQLRQVEASSSRLSIEIALTEDKISFAKNRRSWNELPGDIVNRTKHLNFEEKLMIASITNANMTSMVSKAANYAFSYCI